MTCEFCALPTRRADKDFVFSDVFGLGITENINSCYYTSFGQTVKSHMPVVSASPLSPGSQNKDDKSYTEKLGMSR